LLVKIWFLQTLTVDNSADRTSFKQLLPGFLLLSCLWSALQFWEVLGATFRMNLLYAIELPWLRQSALFHSSVLTGIQEDLSQSNRSYASKFKSHN
jgi:hypothetical protein